MTQASHAIYCDVHANHCDVIHMLHASHCDVTHMLHASQRDATYESRATYMLRAHHNGSRATYILPRNGQ